MTSLQRRARVRRSWSDCATNVREAHDRLSSLEQSLSERDAELAHVRGELDSLAAAQGALEEREQALHDLARRLDRRRAQAVRLTGRLRSLRQVDHQQLSQIERLVADVRGCDAEIARLRSESERARAQTKRFLERLRRERERVESHEEPEPVEIASHLVFVELPDRYELVERAGPPPPRHSPIALPDLDRPLVVAGARRSPLPNDARPCVIAQSPVTAAEQ